MTGPAESGVPTSGVPSGYEIIQLIGQGATAVVLRARDLSTGAEVALKLWTAPLNASAREDFQHEVVILHQLAAEPNVVTLRAADAGDEQTPAWTATELYEESLADRLRNSKIGVDEAYRIADGILAGLEAVHRLGHLHRDIKPANVLLRRNQVALCDLGMSTTVISEVEHASAGTVIAPELSLPGQQPTVRSDIYSAAHTLLFLFGEDRTDALAEILVKASSSRPIDRPPDVTSLRNSVAATFAMAIELHGAGTDPRRVQHVRPGSAREPGSENRVARPRDRSAPTAAHTNADRLMPRAGLMGRLAAPYAPISLDRNLSDLHTKVLTEQQARAIELGIVNPILFKTQWSHWSAGGSRAEDAAVTSVNLPPALVGAVQGDFGRGTIESIYDVLGATGSGKVVVTGSPGSGKTAAAFTVLARALGERNKHRFMGESQLPVPVALTLHGWQETESLGDYIRDQLGRLYPFLHSRSYWLPSFSRTGSVSEIVDRQLVVPILDSLDSLPLDNPSSAHRYLEHLNDYHGRFLLTASSDAWLQLTEQGDRHLFGAAALRLNPLTRGEVQDYLGRMFSHLVFTNEETTGMAPATSDVHHAAAYRLSEPLTQVLSTPLMLGCVRDANLTEAQLRELTDESDEKIEEQLLAHYLFASVESIRRHSPRFDNPVTTEGLRSMAKFLETRQSTDFSYWTFLQSVTVGRVSVRLTVSLVLGALFGLLMAAASSAGHGFGAGIGAGLISSMIAHIGVSRRIGKRRSRTIKSRALRRLLALSAAAGAAYAVRQFFPWVMPRPDMSVSGAVPGAVVVGLVAGAIGTEWAAALSGAVGGLLTGIVAGHFQGWQAGTLNGIGVFMAVGFLTYWSTPEAPGSSQLKVRRPRPLSLIGGTLLLLVLFPMNPVAAVIAVATWVALDSAASQPPRQTYSSASDLWLSEGRRFAYVLASTFFAWTIGVALVVFPHDGESIELLGVVAPLRVILGVTLALVIGVCTATMSSPWIIDRVALRILAYKQRIPLQFVAFLEEVRKAGLLYPIGDVYRFRHVRLQELLARSPMDLGGAEVDSSPDSPASHPRR